MGEQRFVYVEVREATSGGELGALVSFDSVIVTAASEDDAYLAGPSAILRQRAETGDPYFHGDGALLNDYVVAI